MPGNIHGWALGDCVILGMSVSAWSGTCFPAAGDYEVPPGATVWVPFWSLHNSSRNWERPDEFRLVSTACALAQGTRRSLNI